MKTPKNDGEDDFGFFHRKLGLADYKEERHEFQVGFFQGSLKVLKRWWVSTKQAFFWPLDELQAKVLGLDFVGWRDGLETETFLT